MHRYHTARVTFLVAMALGWVGAAAALGEGVDWPRYRGANLDGISAESGWRTDWSGKQPPVLWERNVGVGASSVAVVGDRLYTMGNVDGYDVVSCLNAATGEPIWQKRYECPLDKRMFEGGTAATPVVDDGLVYTLSHQGHLRCYTADAGKLVWSKHYQDDFGGRRPRWGFAGTPLIDGEVIYIDTGAKGASTVALNKKTGAKIWAAGSDEASYAAPMLVTLDGRRQLLLFKAEHLVSVDPTNGKPLWRKPWKTKYDINAAMQIPVGGTRLFVSSGYGTGSALLEYKSGAIREVWAQKDMANQMNTAVHLDGYIYGIDGNNNRGRLMCTRVADGKRMWEFKDAGCGALMVADGHLIVASEKKGKLFVGKASPEGFKPTGVMEGLYKDRCWVAPVLSHGRIYAKGNKGNLVCIDVSR